MHKGGGGGGEILALEGVLTVVKSQFGLITKHLLSLSLL